jgi:hypothetical protein
MLPGPRLRARWVVLIIGRLVPRNHLLDVLECQIERDGSMWLTLMSFWPDCGERFAALGSVRGLFADIHAAWLERGSEVIDRLIAERSEIFLIAMLKMTPVRRVEVYRPEDAKMSIGRPARRGRLAQLKPAVYPLDRLCRYEATFWRQACPVDTLVSRSQAVGKTAIALSGCS